MNKENEVVRPPDLLKYKDRYESRINEFLETDSETRVVFLNADFGLGKTTFIKNCLGVNSNCIYSPWLNRSDNYLEELYYHVNKKNKGKISSYALFIMAVVAIFTILSGSIISILIELFKGDNYECIVENSRAICSSNDSLLSLFIIIMIIIIIVIILLGIVIFIKPIPIINFFKKENGVYYENKIIKGIVKKVDSVLVIEDIDRTDDIEDIFIAINKISSYIVKNCPNKYILVTGDFTRTTRRISDSTMYETYNFDLACRDKGTFLIEKIVSLRIDFPTLENRIASVLKQYKSLPILSKIEYDEIINFMRVKFLSVRFFVDFLHKNQTMINQGYNMYYLLLKYYHDEKHFNIDDSIKNGFLQNIFDFPHCMNDIEMLLQCGVIKTNDGEFHKLIKTKNKKENYNEITNCFVDILNNEETAMSRFKEFYKSKDYPCLISDYPAYDSTVVSIGSTLKPDGMKNDLDNYLIGYSIDNTFGLEEKRCYFPPKKSSNNYELYKINQVASIQAKSVDKYKSFIVAYIACFMRDNENEFKTNYPELYKVINNNMNSTNIE